MRNCKPKRILTWSQRFEQAQQQLKKEYQTYVREKRSLGQEPLIYEHWVEYEYIKLRFL